MLSFTTFPNATKLFLHGSAGKRGWFPLGRMWPGSLRGRPGPAPPPAGSAPGAPRVRSARAYGTGEAGEIHQPQPHLFTESPGWKMMSKTTVFLSEPAADSFVIAYAFFKKKPFSVHSMSMFYPATLFLTNMLAFLKCCWIKGFMDECLTVNKNRLPLHIQRIIVIKRNLF